MMKKKKKEITLDGLAMMVKEGFAKSDKRTDGKIEALAGMVQRGFSDLGSEIKDVKHGQKNLETRFDGVETRLEGVETRLDGVEKRLKSVEVGQEDIKLRLDNVAYHFELKQLDERVTSLERKMAKA